MTQIKKVRTYEFSVTLVAPLGASHDTTLRFTGSMSNPWERAMHGAIEGARLLGGGAKTAVGASISIRLASVSDEFEVEVGD